MFLGERYVYKFVCDPEALFNMAYTEYSQSNRSKTSDSSQDVHRTSYSDMFSLYGTSGGYAHLQQYLGSHEGLPSTPQYKPSHFRLGNPQQFPEQTSNHLQMLQTFSNNCTASESPNTSPICHQQRRNFESPPQHDDSKNSYKNRTCFSDPTSRCRKCDSSPLESHGFKHSPQSDSSLLDGSSTYQCIGVSSCVC